MSDVSGHYTAYVLMNSMENGNDGSKRKWVLFDDAMVSFQVDEEKLVSKNAYLLFYKKKEFSSSTLFNLIYQEQ